MIWDLDLRAKAPVRRRMVLYALLVWPFIWENAAQRYRAAWLLRIPKPPLQALEVVGVVVLIALVLVPRREKRIDPMFLIPVVLFTVHGAVMALVTGSYPMGFFQVTYLTMRPFLVFFAVANLRLGPSELRTVVKFYLVMALLNSLVSSGQFFLQGIYADPAAGLMYHPHTLANYLTLVVLGVVAYSWVAGRRASLALLLLLIPPMLIGRSDKTVILIGPLILATYMCLYAKRLRRLVLAVLVTIPVAVGAVRITEAKAPRFTQLVARLSSDVGAFGPFLAFSELAQAFKSPPGSAIVGFGPGNYGSIFNTFDPDARLRKRPANSERIFSVSQMADTPGARLNVWEPRPNLILAVLSEYGLLGLAMFLYMILRFLVEQARRVRSTWRGRTERWIPLALLIGMLSVLGVGMISVLNGFFNQANVFPLMIVGGILRSIDRHWKVVPAIPDSLTSEGTPAGVLR